MAQKSDGPTVREVGLAEPGAPEFLNKRRATGASDRSLRTYSEILGILRKLSPRPLLELNVMEGEELAAKIATKAMTLNTVARMFFGYHEKEKLAKAFKRKSKERRIDPKTILGVEDINALIGAADNLRDKALVSVLFGSGGRIGETLATTLGDIEEIASPENGGKTFYKLYFGKTKVRGEERGILLIDEAPHVRKWLAKYPLKKTADAPLLPSSEYKHIGKPLTAAGVRDILKALAEKAGMSKPVNPHAFRHARVTHGLRIGEPPAQLSMAIWGKPNSTMLNRYAHLADADVENAMLEARGLKTRTRTATRIAEPSGEDVQAMPAPPLGAGITFERMAELEMKVKSMAGLLEGISRTLSEKQMEIAKGLIGKFLKEDD